MGEGVSTSSSNQQQTSLGPVTFGGVSFGNSGSGFSSTTVLLIVGGAAALLFLWRKLK